ncbi:hypothetical protein AB0M23_16455 [Streptomyces sp. NPDC052077]|uniref:hypothetical protein n=1 Tax=Streptomyces sp. NPDC052077 TaxID=3154757 RepID=UPI00343AAB2A
MAGPEEEPLDSRTEADDALYVLTAVLLTPARFPGVLGDDYPEACGALDLAARGGGYGLVLGQDGEGARWTVVVDDVPLVAVAVASWDCGLEYDLSPDERSVVASLPGWPLAVAVAAPGVPAPHDPDPWVSGRPALAPPDIEVWGPAQRRLGADEIAVQWSRWRSQVDDADFMAPGAGSGSGAVPKATKEAEAVRNGAAPGGRPGAGGHAGVRRVLAEARAYVAAPPPPGRVRSSFATGGARTVRADGPGWSLVARTDDIAFVLLDEEPGRILPVGRGPELPGLLEALDRLAVRPG